MKKYYCFILLLLTILNSGNLFTQSLYLNVKGETKNANQTIDSVGYSKKFSNYLSLEKEAFTLKEKVILILKLKLLLSKMTRCLMPLYI